MSSKQEPETKIKSIGKQNGWLFLPEPRYDPKARETGHFAVTARRLNREQRALTCRTFSDLKLNRLAGLFSRPYPG